MSYWDPSHYGEIGAALEIVLLSVSAVVVGRQTDSNFIRALLGLLVTLQNTACVALYVARVAPL